MLPLDKQNTLREAYARRNAGWQPATEQFAGMVRQHDAGGARLLDLGCGRGGLAEQLERPLKSIIGIDPDHRSLVEHRLPALPRAVGSSARLPLASSTIDVVYAAWVLEHLEAPAADFAEVARVLRPGGAFVFITPHKRHPLIGLNQLLGRLGALQQWLVRQLYRRASVDTFPAYYRANTAQALEQLGVGCGLVLQAVRQVRDPSYWGIARPVYPLLQRLDAFMPPVHLVGTLKKPL